MHGVEGRVVIVTGAGQGIGRGIALHLGKRGASIVVAEWKQHRAERTVAELTELGVSALAVVCDIMHREQIDAMVAQTLDRFGKVDALVNNAQTFRPPAPLATVSEDDVDVFYTSGVKGVSVGHAGRPSAHAGGGLGTHRQLRVGRRHHRDARLRGLQRVEGGHSGAHTHGGARVGP